MDLSLVVLILHVVSHRAQYLVLLFLIYIDDVPQSSSKLVFYLFADDANIYFETKNLELLRHAVNKN